MSPLKWHKWFAWYPVLIDEKWVWMKDVEQRLVSKFSELGERSLVWEYREIHE